MYQRPASSATSEQADALRQATSGLFTITSITIDRPQQGHILFRGQFICDLNNCFDELRDRFEGQGFTPLIRKDEAGLALTAMPYVFDPPASNWLINLLLAALTIFSTLLVATLGELPEAAAAGLSLPDLYLLAVRNLHLGIPFCISLMTILGAHELGHYFAARHHKVPVTLPYFIPLPIPPIGTMGAFIRLKAPVKNKRALFDVGAAGPLAGLVFAIPILIYGLATSSVETLPAGNYMLEGNSILYALTKIAIFGQMLPNGSEDVFLNQMAWAGWVGLLVTGLNLIPVGQLDGGHVAFTLFGEQARKLFWPVIIGLIVLAFITQTIMWGFWAFILFALGRFYAEPLDSVTPLDNRRRWLAAFTLILFLLVFVPIPLQLVS
jgi:hypothetical protein